MKQWTFCIIWFWFYTVIWFSIRDNDVEAKCFWILYIMSCAKRRAERLPKHVGKAGCWLLDMLVPCSIHATHSVDIDLWPWSILKILDNLVNKCETSSPVREGCPNISHVPKKIFFLKNVRLLATRTLLASPSNIVWV